MYFQATILINIRIEYSALISAIQKDWKEEKRNLAEAISQIIRHFEFMKENKKANIMQTSTLFIHRALKRTYTNKKCVKKSLTIYYTDQYWITHLGLRVIYAFGSIRPRGSQMNLCEAFVTKETNVKTKQTLNVDNLQPRILTLRALRTAGQ